MASLSAWKKFLSNAPESQREYKTIELSHPQFEKVYRFVINSVDVDLTLESDAPRNAGELVAFQAVSMSITEPAERQDSEQALSVSFGNADGIAHDIMDQISGTGYFTPVDVVYRKYYSGDLSEPATPPLYLFANSIGFDGPTDVSFTAEDTDLSQKRAGTTYTIEIFPGLSS